MEFSVRGAMRSTVVLGALVVLLCACVPAALAARATTAPGKHVTVYFVIEDKRVAYEILRQSAGGGNDQLYLEKYIVRGDFATFIVINRTKSVHDFTFYGHKYKNLKPGAKKHFSATMLRRGSFPYVSTPGAAKGFKGVFPVY